MASNSTDNFKHQEGDIWEIGGEVRINGGTITANGVQASAISDPTGGATIDAEARSAINDIIDALQGAGILGA